MKKALLLIVFFVMILQLEARPAFIVKVKPSYPNRHVAIPVCPSSRHIWMDGEWCWNPRLNNYEWREGSWVVPQPYAKWVPGHWKQTNQGFYWIAGHWKRKR